MKANKDKGTSVGFSKEYEPYFGWCDVEGCENEGCGGGYAWSETGYWTVCDKHSQEWRVCKPQPQMKQSAIDRENSRDAKGYLPSPPPIDFKISENIEVINKQQWEDIENEFSKFTKRMLNPPFEEYKKWLKENYTAPEKK